MWWPRQALPRKPLGFGTEQAALGSLAGEDRSWKLALPVALRRASGWQETPLLSIVWYGTIQYNTIQYNTIQYNTIQYNTIQYNTE